MGLFSRRHKAPAAAAVHDPQEEARSAQAAPETMLSSDPGLANFLGIGGLDNMTDEVVTIDTALAVPAVMAAVTFLSRTMASLPLKVYARSPEGRQPRPDNAVADLMSWAANDETSAFEARRIFWQDVFTAGRGLAFIERNGRGDPINLWPLEVSKATIARRGGRTLYHYRDAGRPVTYQASEVLDLCFMPGSDRLSARSPIYSNAATIGLALAVTRYGAGFFRNGGIPPFTITGPMRTGAGLNRASEDLTRAVQKLAERRSNALAIPEGHKLDTLGIDPEKMQMVEAQRFIIEQIARIYGLPPVFLQDLTHGTFSNTEQQDLHLVKHTVAQWATAAEGEFNLKFFGRGSREVYCEHSLDGLMRGELKARADATARRINTGQLTINEARELENRPPVAGGDVALVQGAMIPAERAGDDLGARTSQTQSEGEK